MGTNLLIYILMAAVFAGISVFTAFLSLRSGKSSVSANQEMLAGSEKALDAHDSAGSASSSSSKRQPVAILRPHETLQTTERTPSVGKGIIRSPIAEERLRSLREIAEALLEETQRLDRQSGLDSTPNTDLKDLMLESRPDFYNEVRRFETRLIKRALELTGGNQARAARMLGLGTTTLRYKIRSYELGEPHVAGPAKDVTNIQSYVRFKGNKKTQPQDEIADTLSRLRGEASA